MKKESEITTASKAKKGNVKALKLSSLAFDNSQLSLFQDFLCNKDDERDKLSNTIHLWDSIPRYSVSRQAMTKMRSQEGTLKLLKLEFNFGGAAFRAIIHPARIEVEVKTKNDNGELQESNLVEMDFYPSAPEELIEDALRKIAAEQQQGFFDKNSFRSGVVFTLHMLREELKLRGHTRSLQEIKMSLHILAKSNIEIIDCDNTRSGESGFAVSSYLPALAGVTRRDLEANPDAKWVIQFHPLVTQSIDKLTFRQFDYHLMMSHKSQLTRWLHKQLAQKFTFAGHGKTFEIRFSTIYRDSAMLNGYNACRMAIAAVDDSFAELKAQKVLMLFTKEEIRGGRNKLIDAVYTLTASVEFIASIKAANKKFKDANEATKPASVTDPIEVATTELQQLRGSSVAAAALAVCRSVPLLRA
jgi:hypothetical protein